MTKLIKVLARLGAKFERTGSPVGLVGVAKGRKVVARYYRLDGVDTIVVNNKSDVSRYIYLTKDTPLDKVDGLLHSLLEEKKVVRIGQEADLSEMKIEVEA